MPSRRRTPMANGPDGAVCPAGAPGSTVRKTATASAERCRMCHPRIVFGRSFSAPSLQVAGVYSGARVHRPLRVGFALKRVAPRASLGAMIAAPEALDLLWPWFLLLGWERVRIDPGNTAFTPLAFDSYPISHSLVMAAVWGALFASLYIWMRGTRAAAVWIGFAVVSHWVLDWVTHRPDLPIAPWSDVKVGLGLWNSVPGDARGGKPDVRRRRLGVRARHASARS